MWGFQNYRHDDQCYTTKAIAEPLDTLMVRLLPHVLVKSTSVASIGLGKGGMWAPLWSIGGQASVSKEHETKID